MGAAEASSDGLFETGEPHRSRFRPGEYAISPKIYTAKKMLDRAKEDLRSVIVSGQPLADLQARLLSALGEAAGSVEAQVVALERTTRNAWGVDVRSPDWSRAKAAVDEISLAFRKLDESFITAFVALVKDKHPELLDKLHFYALEIYENRGKSDNERADIDRAMGHLGVQFRLSRKEPVIWTIVEDGPADDAYVEKDDVILGVDGGPEFKSQSDYKKFQKKTKPGETYKFKILRKGKEKLVSVTMN